MPRYYVPKDLRKRLHEGQNYVPSQREFVNELIALAGGPKALATVIWTELQSDKCPPSVRARALEIVLKAMKAVEKEERPPDPTDMTDEELKAFIDQRLSTLIREGDESGSPAD